jgi:glucose-6-phosphate 1-dehydrogenase
MERVTMSEKTETNPLREGMPEERAARPCALVIFGASGDLTKRKLVPAVYNLGLSRLLPSGFALIGVARRDKPDFADEMKGNVAKFSRRKPLDDTTWHDLSQGITYVKGDFEADPTTFDRLKAALAKADEERGTAGSRVFYLSVAPTEVPKIVRGLREHGLVSPPSPDKDAPFQRVIVEKPFGRDLQSAEAMNRELLAHLAESQIYRIDHYLGKETVQNMMVLRFGNTIFEPLWSRHYVDHVQITVAEDIGVEGRAAFYEDIGITRDIVQNHALQLLTLVAMEPPSSWDADAVRDEKVKVLRALRRIGGKADVLAKTVRAQYAAGTVRGDKVPGFRTERNEEFQRRHDEALKKGSVADAEKYKAILGYPSPAETYAAINMRIDNWRWSGVPFYLRAGKRLAKRVAEVVLHFKELPHGLFGKAGGEPNSLVMRIQPDEGISLRFATKVPGQGMAIREVAMDFRYGTEFGSSTPEAYERLILDAMRGEATLFTRADEVEAQWQFIDPILQGWSAYDAPFAEYEAGTWGPREADQLLEPERTGDTWRRP